MVVGCLEVGLVALFPRVASSENPLRSLGQLTNGEIKATLASFYTNVVTLQT